MASRVKRRRWSIDHPPAFSNLTKKFKYVLIDSFIKVFDRKKPRMRGIVCGLKKIAAEVKRMKQKPKSLRVTGLASAAVGVVVVSAAALFTGTFSFPILGAVTVFVAACATAEVFTEKQFTQQKRSRKIVKEFLKIVELLRSELEEIKKACEDLQRESVGATKEKIVRLRDNINQLLDDTAKLRTSTTSDCITSISDQFKKTVGEFEKMRRQLKDIRESIDTEK